ncbi:MAG: hypothetical protein HOM55_08335 [Proteobacteria bacterium]|jgi:hypothetical protein|nr:hypothetical protein [Pseudomonadota bacterium]
MSNKKIIFIHGKNSKPNPALHRELLLKSLRAGFAGSRFSQEMREFNEADFALSAWSDLLYSDYDDAHDLSSAVDQLLAVPGERQPSMPLFGRFAMLVRRCLYLWVDRFPALMRLLPTRHAEFMLEGSVQYLENRDGVAVSIRKRLADTMKTALTDPAHELLIIAHSLGSVVAYDLLASRPRWLKPRSVRLMTLGSPLGLRFTQARVLGEMTIFPSAISSWDNLSAYGDMVSLDTTLHNDFHQMEELDLLEKISDRSGIVNNYRDIDGDNPHKSYGYLANHRVAETIAAWYLGCER